MDMCMYMSVYECMYPLPLACLYCCVPPLCKCRVVPPLSKCRGVPWVPAARVGGLQPFPRVMSWSTPCCTRLHSDDDEEKEGDKEEAACVAIVILARIIYINLRMKVDTVLCGAVTCTYSTRHTMLRQNCACPC